MNKILKFPDLNNPASKKEFKILAEYINTMEEHEAIALKYKKKSLKKIISISNHVKPLTKKEKNELLKEIKEDYKYKIEELKNLLHKNSK